MPTDINQDGNLDANPNNGADLTPENNQGNNNGNVQPQTKPEINTDEGKKYSQKDIDGAQAKARGTAERETKKKFLAQLGLKEDEEDKLLKFKEAYEASLSDEEKKNQVMEDLQAENLVLSQSLEEKDYVIKALVELTGKNEEDVEKIVKMAKGLKTEENTIEDAIKECISMLNIDNRPAEPNVDTTQPNPNMPEGQPIQQPSKVIFESQDNPFKQGQINLTKQGQLIKSNPELAKKLAKEAGYELKF